MADTIDPTKLDTDAIQNSASVLGNVHIQASNATEALVNFGTAGMEVTSVMGQLENKLHMMKAALSETGDLGIRQSAAFSALSVSVLGARESFKVFETATPTLNTFTGQITDTIALLTAQNAPVGTLVETLSRAGVNVPKEKIKEGAGAVKTFALEMAKSADNALRLQAGLFQMSAVTGSLTKVTDAAGTEFERMNELSGIHDAMIRSTAESMQVSADVAEQYYMKLGQVPGALESTVDMAEKGGAKVSMLSATMSYAIGSGRDYSEVIDDLKLAYTNMGLEGENALKFTARMGEISNKFGVELSVVRQSLKAATEDLKKFGGEGMKNGDIIQGAARMMNDYTKALKSTGISGASAIGIVQDMTNKIANLDVAQRAFLSQRSGGAGGLRGAFQIENMIKSGNIDEVMRKVQSTMQQQFGKIVTGEEAAKSESAASRAIMQRQMLQQGPLGAFAKSEQDAARILEAFSARSEGKISEKELSDTIVQETMDKGLKFQELSATHLGVLRGIAESTRGAANQGSLGLLQQTMAARVGTRDFVGTSIPAEEEMRANTKRSMERGRNLSGQRGLEIGVTGKDLANQSGIGSLGKVTSEAMKSWSEFFEGLPAALTAPVGRIKSLIDSGDKGKSAEKMQELQDNLARIREEEARAETEQEKQALHDRANRFETVLTGVKGYQQEMDRIKKAGENTREFAEGTTSASTVKTAVQNTSNVRSAEVAAAEASERKAMETTTTEAVEPIDINLHIETACVNCGTKIRSSHQDTARLPVPKQ